MGLANRWVFRAEVVGRLVGWSLGLWMVVGLREPGEGVVVERGVGARDEGRCTVRQEPSGVLHPTAVVLRLPACKYIYQYVSPYVLLLYAAQDGNISNAWYEH